MAPRPTFAMPSVQIMTDDPGPPSAAIATEVRTAGPKAVNSLACIYASFYFKVSLVSEIFLVILVFPYSVPLLRR